MATCTMDESIRGFASACLKHGFAEEMAVCTSLLKIRF